jgi:hypothetical protein
LLPAGGSSCKPGSIAIAWRPGAAVKARYSKHYRINEDELAWLGARVEDLGRVVAAICAERIEALEKSFAA